MRTQKEVAIALPVQISTGYLPNYVGLLKMFVLKAKLLEATLPDVLSLQLATH